MGDMARYGLDYASLTVLNPKLVYCSVTGFGQTGPYAERAGDGYAVQGMGRLMRATGCKGQAISIPNTTHQNIFLEEHLLEYSYSHRNIKHRVQIEHIPCFAEGCAG